MLIWALLDLSPRPLTVITFQEDALQAWDGTKRQHGSDQIPHVFHWHMPESSCKKSEGLSVFTVIWFYLIAIWQKNCRSQTFSVTQPSANIQQEHLLNCYILPLDLLDLFKKCFHCIFFQTMFAVVPHVSIKKNGWTDFFICCRRIPSRYLWCYFTQFDSAWCSTTCWQSCKAIPQEHPYRKHSSNSTSVQYVLQKFSPSSVFTPVGSNHICKKQRWPCTSESQLR